MALRGLLQRLAPEAIVAVTACSLALGVMTLGEVAAARRRAATDRFVASVLDRGTGGLSPSDEGRFVRAVGAPGASGPAVDEATGASIRALLPRREVQMWQRRGRPLPDGTWRLEEAWDETPAIPYGGSIASLAQIPPNPPFPFRSADILAPGPRIGLVPIDIELARLSRDFERRSVSAEALAAVRSRFPDRAVSLDGEWIMIATSGEARTVGDLRLRYVDRDARGLVTVIGRAQDGRLHAAWSDPLNNLALPGDVPLREMLSSTILGRPAEWAWAGRIVGLAILVMALLFVALGGLKRRPEEEGGGWGWGFGGLALASGGDDPVSAAIGVVVLIALLPFALAVAPVAIVLALLAWWMALGAMHVAAGIVVFLAVATAALALTARGDPASEGA